MNPEPGIFVGIDVQIRRRCAFVALNSDLRMIDSGWLEGGSPAEICAHLTNKLRNLKTPENSVQIGIDAPRQPLPAARAYYWDRVRSRWRPRRPSERGWGRHCEVVIRSCGIANPQWTPTEPESPKWMRLGYALFRHLEDHGYPTHEVFPSAAYAMLKNESHAPVSIDFSSFAGGPKDMLDACVAAFVVHEYSAGRGVAVGDDGLGTIVLPRPLPDDTPEQLLKWPAECQSP